MYKAVSQAKQGQGLGLGQLERTMEASRIRVLIGATYDLLPSPEILNR